MTPRPLHPLDSLVAASVPMLHAIALQGSPIAAPEAVVKVPALVLRPLMIDAGAPSVPPPMPPVLCTTAWDTVILDLGLNPPAFVFELGLKPNRFNLHLSDPLDALETTITSRVSFGEAEKFSHSVSRVPTRK